MRSFEVPAMGGCPLLEDTSEHREIFGNDMEYKYYFNNPNEMINNAKALLGNLDERLRISRIIRDKIVSSNNTYQDRINQMVKIMNHSRI